MDKINKLTKEVLLKITLGGWLYIIKIFPNLIKIDENKCQVTLNHLRGEKNPSLSFYKRKDKWHMNDFARSGYSGDVFNLYAIVNGIDDVKGNFPEIIQGIYRDTFNEEPPQTSYKNKTKKRFEESTLPEGKKFEINERSFSELNKYEEAFLEKYNISVNTMRKLDISFISDYTFTSRAKKVFKITSVEDDIIIAHRFRDSYKVYKPNADNYKHTFLGDFERGYFIGEKQFRRLKFSSFSEKEEVTIVLCAGMKDAMVLTELGFLAISLNSETTSNLPDNVIDDIHKMEDYLDNRVKIKIVYDLDDTGVEQSNNIEDRLNFINLFAERVGLPDKLSIKEGKDVADWISLNLPEQELRDLIGGENFNFALYDFDYNFDSSSVSPISLDTQNPYDDSGLSYADIVEEGLADSRLSYTDIVEEGLDDYPVKKPSRIKDLKEINVQIEEVDNVIEETEEMAEIESKNSILEIPQEVYNNFPELLKKAIKPFDDDSKTMMSLAFITVLGSVLMNIKAKLRKDTFYANLYTIIVAPPASGKSLMKWARSLILPIDNLLIAKSDSDLSVYKRKYDEYKKGNINRDELGDKPPYKVQLIPADITSAMWVKQMYDNDGNGIMYDTEIDGLIESNSGNLRSFTDYLRKVWENEPIAMMRKTDSERVRVEEGKMSLLLSGTPKQHLKLLPSAENGLFSRIISLQFKGSNSWKTVLETDDFDYDKYFEKLSPKVLTLFKKLNDRETFMYFKLTNDQLIKLDNEFMRRTDRVTKIAGKEGRATVYRLAPMTVKIAMILSSIRQINYDFIGDELICDDDDFNSALTISGVILEHALRTLKIMNNERVESAYRGKKLDYYYALPDSFSFKESQQIAAEEDVKIKTAEKWIYAFRNNGFLLNPVKGQFHKV